MAFRCYNFMLLLTNYLSNQHAIILFAHLFDQSASYYSFSHFSTNQHAITVFSLFMVTSKQNDTGLIAHSSMELSTGTKLVIRLHLGTVDCTACQNTCKDLCCWVFYPCYCFFTHTNSNWL